MIDALVTGKLIKNPTELKTGQSGAIFCNFRLAVPTDSGSVAVSGIAFGDAAERISRLVKGDPVSVIGGLNPTEWADKTTGEIEYHDK